ncbi:D-alanyl-D-alanine carboxypeptidase family protein [Candidatus Gracilibacteria bacterium]|nr:D-alanyl-D-alanine carboxypeptidase family protein [Candidatus Gracilibacteria bacterium]
MTHKIPQSISALKKHIQACIRNIFYDKRNIFFLILYLLMVLSSGYLIYLIHEERSQTQYILDIFTTHDFYIEKNILQDLDTEVEEEKIQDFDFIFDDSYQKYVDPEVPFIEKSYIPSDLRRLSGDYISDTRGDLRLRGTAAQAFENLAQDFYRDMGEKVVVVSSYRSYERQVQIKAGGCPDHLCAKAGYSEHQSGLAIDVWSASTEAYWKSSPRLMRFYEWFYENAHLYGYHNSYQNGVEIDGYAIEPWHWRYLGVELASYLREQEITFAEYYYSL